MEILIAEASTLDWLEALDDNGTGRAVTYRHSVRGLATMIAGGSAITFRAPGGDMILMAGLQADDEDPSLVELWFAAGVALRANLLPALRQARAILEQIAGEISPVTVAAYVEPGRVAGRRLARTLGFNPAGVRASAIGPLEVWTRSF